MNFELPPYLSAKTPSTLPPYLVRAGWATFSRLGDWVQTVGLFTLFRLTQDFTVVTGACCAVVHFENFTILVNPVHFLHEARRCTERKEKENDHEKKLNLCEERGDNQRQRR